MLGGGMLLPLLVVGTALLCSQCVLHHWLHETANHRSEFLLENPPSSQDPAAIDRVRSRLLWRGAQSRGTLDHSPVIKPSSLSETPAIDYVVIAGAWTLPGKKCGLSRAFKQRILAGLDIAEATGAKAILVSGGRNDTYCGVTYLKHLIMKRWQAACPQSRERNEHHACTLGRVGSSVYTPDDFLLENDSTTTNTNAVFTLGVLQADVKRHPDRSLSRTVVVTSPCHLKRTSFFFRQVFGAAAAAGEDVASHELGATGPSFAASHPDEFEWVLPARRMYWAEHLSTSVVGTKDILHAETVDLKSSSSLVQAPVTAFKSAFPSETKSSIGMVGASGSSTVNGNGNGEVMTTMLSYQEDWWFEEMEEEDLAMRQGRSPREPQHLKQERYLIDPTEHLQTILPHRVTFVFHTVRWNWKKWVDHLRATAVSIEWISEGRELGGFAAAWFRKHITFTELWEDLVRFVFES